MAALVWGGRWVSWAVQSPPNLPAAVNPGEQPANPHSGMNAPLATSLGPATAAASLSATHASAQAGLGAAAEFALRTVTEIQAAVLSHTELKAAAQALSRESASRLGFTLVSVGLLKNGDMQVVADSEGFATEPEIAHGERLAQAMVEALDQMCSLSLPQSRPAEQPRITLALEQLLQTEPGSAASVPVVANGKALGALCAQRSGGGQISSQELALLEQLAALAAPVLQLMQHNERPWHRRLKDATQARWKKAEGSTPLVARAAAAMAAVMLLAVLLWPGNAWVGGHARVEGAVQRTLVAPMDGFLGQVHVRPGDTVRAGQLLAVLADQDLQIERARWESQIAQHENAYVAAQATANRTQLVINQSKASEAEAQLDLVNAKLARARIAAPFDGVVIQGDLSQQLGAPLQQGAELMTLAPLGQYRVIVEVDERDIGSVKLGQEGSMALSALPWDTQALRVVRITPVANVVLGRNVYEVEATLVGAPPDGLRPGLQGTAHLQSGSAPRVWNWTRRLVDAARLFWWELFG
jgi:multidrug resistance efflux pump